MLDLDMLEFAVLVDKAGINRVPMVASYRNYGTVIDDVGHAFEVAEQRCRDKGLMDRAGKLDPRVGEMLAVYPNASVEYDLRFSMQRGTELRATVSGAGRAALRSVVSGDRIYLEQVQPDQLIVSLVAILPEHGPMRMQPLSVDLAAMRSAMSGFDEDNEPDRQTIESRLRSKGADTRQFRRMGQILDTQRLGVGELGVTVFGDRGSEARGEQTLRLMDLEQGRVVIYNSGGHRMLCGGDGNTLARVMAEVTERARKSLHW